MTDKIISIKMIEPLKGRTDWYDANKQADCIATFRKGDEIYTTKENAKLHGKWTKNRRLGLLGQKSQTSMKNTSNLHGEESQTHLNLEKSGEMVENGGSNGKS